MKNAPLDDAQWMGCFHASVAGIGVEDGASGTSLWKFKNEMEGLLRMRAGQQDALNARGKLAMEAHESCRGEPKASKHIRRPPGNRVIYLLRMR